MFSRARIKTLASQTTTNPCLPENTENHQNDGFFHFTHRKNHLWFTKCSKFLDISQFWRKVLKSGRSPVRHDGFDWIRDGLWTPPREHLLRTFPVGIRCPMTTCCTSGSDGSKVVRHFQNGSLASQTWRCDHYSSVRWPGCDDFRCFSWISWNSVFCQKRLLYCSVLTRILD